MTIYLANGIAVSLLARETASAAADRNMFEGDMKSSTVGAMSVAVPGEVIG